MSSAETKRLIERGERCFMIASVVSTGWLYLWYRITGNVVALTCILLLLVVDILVELSSIPCKLLMDEYIDEEKGKADWNKLLKKLDNQRPYK